MVGGEAQEDRAPRLFLHIPLLIFSSGIILQIMIFKKRKKNHVLINSDVYIFNVNDFCLEILLVLQP